MDTDAMENLGKRSAWCLKGKRGHDRKQQLLSLKSPHLTSVNAVPPFTHFLLRPEMRKTEEKSRVINSLML